MKKLIIADITTLTYEEKIYGHFLKVANDYKNLFSNKYKVSIAGGPTYSKFINEDSLIKLPFIVNKNICINKFQNIISKFKETINAIYTLKIDSDIIIFQCYSELPIYIAILLFAKEHKNIYLIQYQKGLNNIISRLIYKLVFEKINGIITSTKEVGEYYNKRYELIPDYLVFSDCSYINPEINNNYKHDFLCIGTMSDGKDIEEIVTTFNNTKYKVCIVGNFSNKNRYNNLNKICTDNIKILDQYLNDEEYCNYINEAKFIVLPYKYDSYNEKSSGVVLDSLYRGKPVIVPRIDSFNFVRENKIGFIYNSSIVEVLKNIEEEQYESIIGNINDFILRNKTYNEILLKFINDNLKI